MRIYSHRPRDEIFNPFTDVEAIREALLKKISDDHSSYEKYMHIAEGTGNITTTALKAMVEEGIIVLGSKDSLEEILDPERPHHIDYREHIEQIEVLKPGQVLLLPAEFDVVKKEFVYYDFGEYMSLSRKGVWDDIEGIHFDSRKMPIHKGFSDKALNAFQMDPVIVLLQELNSMNQRFEELKKGPNYKLQGFLRKNLFGYKFNHPGKDKRWRDVPFDRLVDGAELRVFQNITAYFVLAKRYEKELETGVDSATGKRLSSADKRFRIQEKTRYMNIAYMYGFDKLPREMLTEFDDMFRINGLANNSCAEFQIPSRGRDFDQEILNLLGEKEQEKLLYWQTRLFDAPLLRSKPQRAYALSWIMWWTCQCPDYRWQSQGVFEEKAGKGMRHILACAHSIAASHFLQYESRKQRQKNDIRGLFYCNPFAIPAPKLSRFVDNYRYQTVIIDRNGERRGPHKSEIAKVIGMYLKTHKSDEGFLSRQQFREKRVDPMTYLVQIV